MQNEPTYLFPYWLDEQYLPTVKKMHSSDISNLYDQIGGMQRQRLEFIRQWIEHIKPIGGIYYDITSISSYSSKIDFIEWGYNRDKENLPQLNLGLVCNQRNSLPFFYTVFPGSVVDVSTLKNAIHYLKLFKLEGILLVLDRGFCSTSNIIELNNDENKIKFIQPLSFSMKIVKELIFSHKSALHDSHTAFKFNDEIIHHTLTQTVIGGEQFDAHIFLNEKAEVDQKNNFLSKLLEIEEGFKNKEFQTAEDYKNYSNDNLPDKYKKYYQWDKQTKKIERDDKNINTYMSNIGYFVLATNEKNTDKSFILSSYRDRDGIEKIFDIYKNETDSNRLRVHSQWNVEGKFFIKFITVIIYMSISRIMKDYKLYDKYTIREMILELKKIKLTLINPSEETIVSEITKKQRELLEAFNVHLNHSY
jgi:transposase